MVMLVTLSAVFVVCLLPHCVVLTVFSVLEIIDGDLIPVTYTLTFLLETINCSVSCIIYYKMSSKYRDLAKKMLGAFKNFILTAGPVTSPCCTSCSWRGVDRWEGHLSSDYKATRKSAAKCGQSNWQAQSRQQHPLVSRYQVRVLLPVCGASAECHG
ncbi:psychosine receptor [Biomphalaria glabrata]|nr:psychosine receptor-like [Biomphalaria glabrata]